MPCSRKYIRIRAKDVGRPKHHYILLGIKRKKGSRGGRTEKIKLKLYKKKKNR